MLGIYRAATLALGPVLALYLLYRRRIGKEDPARRGERAGIAGRARPPGPLIWLHGASVGEAVSVLPLIERLLAEGSDRHVLLTTATVTSAGLMAERLPARAIHQYAPIDHPRAVRRFLDHWRPDLAVWIESEIWPNLICATAGRGIPLQLIQGRLSQRSFRRWARLPKLARSLLRRFDVCLAQDEAAAERYRRLGARDVRVMGNLKDAAPPLPADDGELSRLQAAIGRRPCWVAASTHAGEEAAVADAARAVKAAHPDVLTIVAPRHPGRADEVARTLSARGLALGRRSEGLPDAATEVLIVDTIGELGLCYRVADIAFIGGSLVPHGGHNAAEAARLGCAVLHGPDMTNFEALAATLRRADAAIEVSDADQLGRSVGALLGDPGRRRRLARRAAQAAAPAAGAIDRIHTLVAARLAAEPAAGRREAGRHARA